MKRIPPVDIRDARQRLQDVLFKAWNQSTTDRRTELLKCIAEWQATNPEGVLVNRRHCAVLSRDKDIMALLKKKSLIRVRTYDAFGTGKTYIRIP